VANLSLVPNWILARQSLPHGVRGPKRPRWTDARDGYTPYAGVFKPLTEWHAQNRYPHLFNPALRQDKVINILPEHTDRASRPCPPHGGDFRYFCGTVDRGMNENYSVCRACGEVLISKKGRQEHRKAGCGALLENTFKRIARSGICVICSKQTKRKSYGLPFCSNNCELTWEFERARPHVLEFALQETRQEKDKKKKEFEERHAV